MFFMTTTAMAQQPWQAPDWGTRISGFEVATLPGDNDTDLVFPTDFTVYGSGVVWTLNDRWRRGNNSVTTIAGNDVYDMQPRSASTITATGLPTGAVVIRVWASTSGGSAIVPTFGATGHNITIGGVSATEVISTIGTGGRVSAGNYAWFFWENSPGGNLNFNADWPAVGTAPERLRIAAIDVFTGTAGNGGDPVPNTEAYITSFSVGGMPFTITGTMITGEIPYGAGALWEPTEVRFTVSQGATVGLMAGPGITPVPVPDVGPVIMDLMIGMAPSLRITSEDGETIRNYSFDVTEGPAPTLIRTWDFTAWSPITMADLEADANWVREGAAGRFTRPSGQALTANATVLANGNPIRELEGIQFAHSGTLGNNTVRIDYGMNPVRLNLNGSNIRLVMPNTEAGDIITITFLASGSGQDATGGRGFTVLEGVTSANNANSISTEPAITNTYTVTTGGTVWFQVNQGVNISEITLSRAHGTPIPVAPTFMTFGVYCAELAETLPATITRGAITAELPYGADLENLVVTYTLSGDAATVSTPAGAVTSGTTEVNFTSMVPVTLNWSGAPVVFNATITVATPVPPTFTAFSVYCEEIGTINLTSYIDDGTITATLPLGTVLEDMVVTFTLGGDPAEVTIGTEDFESGDTWTFVNGTPTIFTLTPTIAGTAVNYEVTLTVSQDAVPPSFATFTVAGVSATVNNVANTITVEVPYAIGVTSLVVAYTLDGDPATVSTPQGAVTSGTTEVNFTSPVVFTLTPVGAGDPVTYTVTVTRGDPPAFTGTNTILINAAFFAAMTPPITGDAPINGTWMSSDGFFIFAGSGNDGRWRQGQGGGVFETGQNGAGHVMFTTVLPSTVTFRASSTGGGNNSAVTLWNAAGDAQVEASGRRTVAEGGAVGHVLTFENIPAGTWRIVSNGTQVAYPLTPAEANPTLNRGVRIHEITVVQQDGDIPSAPVAMYWRTSAAVPAWISASRNISELRHDTTAIGTPAQVVTTTRELLNEANDYFIVALPTGDLTANERLISTEFRWNNRSNAVVRIEQSPDGTAWTEIQRVANNATDVSPGATRDVLCVESVAGQDGAMLISNAVGSDGFTRFVNLQSRLLPATRYVRYTMVQNDIDVDEPNVYFIVQAIGVRDFTHTENVLRTDFRGLQDLTAANSTQDLLGMDGTTVIGTIHQSHGRMFNRNEPASNNMHPCASLRITSPVGEEQVEGTTNVRFGANFHAMTVALEEPIRRPGALVLGVASHSNDAIRLYLEYSTDGTNFVTFNDTIWVIAQTSVQTMHFDFPQVREGITHFRASRIGAGVGGTVTWFMFNMGVYYTPAPPALALGSVTFDDYTLHFDPWVFTLPNAPITIAATDLAVTPMVPAETESVEAVDGSFPVVMGAGVNEAYVAFRITANANSDVLSGFAYDTVWFRKDTDRPEVIWQTPNLLGLGETGTVTIVWNEPVQRLARNTGNVMINGVNATSVAELNATGDTLRIAYTAAHWNANLEMNIVIQANAFEDFYLNTNLEQVLVQYTRDITPPAVLRTSMEDGFQYAPMRGGLIITLTEPIVAPGVNWNAFTLNDTPLVLGTSIFHITDSARSVLVVPYRDLVAYEDFRLVIPADQIVDPAGNTFVEDFVFEFRTGGPLWLAQGETFETGNLRELRGDFVQPSWIVKNNRAAHPITNMMQARAFIGFNPASTENIGGGDGGFNVGEGGIHMNNAADSVALHFDGIGTLRLLMYANGGRTWTLRASHWPEGQVMTTTARVAGATAGTGGQFQEWWTNGIEIDQAGPVTIYLWNSGTGYLLEVEATAGPQNEEAYLLTLIADGQNIPVQGVIEHELLFGSDLAGVEIEFVTSHRAVVRINNEVVESGDLVPFTTPNVEFVITSEDGEEERSYFVTFTVATAPSIATFRINFADATIEGNQITREIAADQDIREVIIDFTTTPVNAEVRVDGAIITRFETMDFFNPVQFLVRNPEGGADVIYVVTVTGGYDSGDPSSVQDLDLAVEVISFYPNPTTDILNISATNIRTIEVINMMGQVVIQTRGSGNTHTLDVSNLSPGLHFIRVTTDTGVSVGRFIKQ